MKDGPVENLSGQESIISFGELGRSDFPMLQKWLAAPHVGVWWNERFDLASLEAKHGPAIDGSEPIHVYVIQCDGVPIGWIQWYRWRDFPEHARHDCAHRASRTSLHAAPAAGRRLLTFHIETTHFELNDPLSATTRMRALCDGVKLAP